MMVYDVLFIRPITFCLKNEYEHKYEFINYLLFD